MNSRSHYFDWELIIPVLFLLVLGITVIGSLAPQLLLYQVVFAIVSLIVFLVVSHTDYKIFQSLHVPIYVVSVVSLLLPFVFGAASRGAHRWLQFGSISIQPSELIKPFLMITFSIIAVSTFPKKILLLIGAFVIPGLIVFLQPDLGTSMVLGVAWFAMFISLIPFRWIFGGALILALLSPIGWNFLRDYQKDRLITFVNPYHDPLGRGYHVIQSVIAVGSGQLMGRGLGHGTQSQLRFLPESHTDFIFASLSEDLGFVGGFLVIFLMALVLLRIYKISRVTADRSASMFCVATLAMLGFQTFVNVGMNMGIVPITGITLPFLSYGGSSLLSLSIVLGIVHSISATNAYEKKF